MKPLADQLRETIAACREALHLLGEPPDGEPPPKGDPPPGERMPAARARVLLALAAGPLRTTDLEAETGLSRRTLTYLLASPWFHKGGNRFAPWQLTAAGRAELSRRGTAPASATDPGGPPPPTS